MKLPRRNFLRLAAGAAALPAAPHFAWAQVPPATSQPVRVATGLLATWQSTAWLGAEAGLFKTLQKARDRYDPAGHCGRRSGGRGRAHPR
jgi:hypothetical protein